MKNLDRHVIIPVDPHTDLDHASKLPYPPDSSHHLHDVIYFLHEYTHQTSDNNENKSTLVHG